MVLGKFGVLFALISNSSRRRSGKPVGQWFKVSLVTGCTRIVALWAPWFVSSWKPEIKCREDSGCQISGQGKKKKKKSGMCFYLLSIPVKWNGLSSKHVLLLRPETVYIGLNPEWSMWHITPYDKITTTCILCRNPVATVQDDNLLYNKST